MIIAVDFDGTCVTHKFPELGRDIGAAPVLRELVANGHKLMLWTMRSDQAIVDTSHSPELHPEASDYLSQAVRWFMDRDIPLWGINNNHDQKTWTSSPKQYAHVYIDDAALGAPLIHDPTCERPYLDWVAARRWLVNIGAIQAQVVADSSCASPGPSSDTPSQMTSSAGAGAPTGTSTSS